MPDQTQPLPKTEYKPSMTNFFVFCFITVGIILICVFAGGYTSFMRADNRIKASTEFFTDACQKRLELLPELISISKNSSLPEAAEGLTRAADHVNKILQIVISQKTPIEKELIKELENTETDLTLQLKSLFLKLESLTDHQLKLQLAAWKEKFYLAQNNLFVTKKRYNDEVAYFNTRKKSLLPSVFAKLYGFNKLVHTQISPDLFVPANAMFELKKS